MNALLTYYSAPVYKLVVVHFVNVTAAYYLSLLTVYELLFVVAYVCSFVYNFVGMIAGKQLQISS